jgi:hypothetical protein
MSSTFQCSPALHRRDGETCLPPSALERLRRVWNRTHPRHKITIAGTRKANNKSNAGNTRVNRAGTKEQSQQLWNKLREAMKNHYKCDTEFCLVKKLPGLDAADKENLKAYFRPEKPAEWDSKPTTWLDSFNIEDVMNQYEAADPTFEFIGPVPIDFDEKNTWGKCIVDELCKLNLQHVARNGTKKIGIIFNLDPHDEPGSHWVCAYVDIEGKAAYYFDSYGYEPQEEIVRFLKRCMEQGCDKIVYNDVRHQRKGSECGMYCLFVIICLLRGRPFYNVCKQVVDDDTMNAFRDILFAEEKPRKEALDTALERLCI